MTVGSLAIPKVQIFGCSVVYSIFLIYSSDGTSVSRPGKFDGGSIIHIEG